MALACPPVPLGATAAPDQEWRRAEQSRRPGAQTTGAGGLHTPGPEGWAALGTRVWGARPGPRCRHSRSTHPGPRRSSACSGWRLSPGTCRTGASSTSRTPAAGSPGRCRTSGPRGRGTLATRGCAAVCAAVCAPHTDHRVLRGLRKPLRRPPVPGDARPRLRSAPVPRRKGTSPWSWGPQALSRDIGSVGVRTEHQGRRLPAPPPAPASECALCGVPQLSAHAAVCCAAHPPPPRRHLGRPLGVVNMFWKEEIKNDICAFLVS